MIHSGIMIWLLIPLWNKIVLFCSFPANPVDSSGFLCHSWWSSGVGRSVLDIDPETLVSRPSDLTWKLDTENGISNEPKVNSFQLTKSCILNRVVNMQGLYRVYNAWALSRPWTNWRDIDDSHVLECTFPRSAAWCNASQPSGGRGAQDRDPEEMIGILQGQHGSTLLSGYPRPRGATTNQVPSSAPWGCR